MSDARALEAAAWAAASGTATSEQLATLATYYRVPAGELAEGLLRELGLVPRGRTRFAGTGGGSDSPVASTM